MREVNEWYMSVLPFVSDEVLDHILIRHVASSYQSLHEIFLDFRTGTSRPGAHPAFVSISRVPWPKKRLRLRKMLAGRYLRVGHLYRGLNELFN